MQMLGHINQVEIPNPIQMTYHLFRLRSDPVLLRSQNESDNHLDIQYYIQLSHFYLQMSLKYRRVIVITYS